MRSKLGGGWGIWGVENGCILQSPKHGYICANPTSDLPDVEDPNPCQAESCWRFVRQRMKEAESASDFPGHHSLSDPLLQNLPARAGEWAEVSLRCLAEHWARWQGSSESPPCAPLFCGSHHFRGKPRVVFAKPLNFGSKGANRKPTVSGGGGFWRPPTC